MVGCLFARASTHPESRPIATRTRDRDPGVFLSEKICWLGVLLTTTINLGRAHHYTHSSVLFPQSLLPRTSRSAVVGCIAAAEIGAPAGCRTGRGWWLSARAGRRREWLWGGARGLQKRGGAGEGRSGALSPVRQGVRGEGRRRRCVSGEGTCHGVSEVRITLFPALFSRFHFCSGIGVALVR